MLPPEQQKPPEILASPALRKCALRLFVACILFALLGLTAAEQPPSAPPIASQSTPARTTTSPRLYHEVIGGAGVWATPMVMIHGFGENTYAWRHLARPLARARQMVLVDLKGFGYSPEPETINIRQSIKLV